MPGDVHDISYYQKCMIGGILSCGLTHTAICPLDIVKCRKQVNPTLYKSIGDGMKVINRTEGFSGFTVGWLPTLFGYSLQGFAKFGFYEIFKDVYKGAFGEAAYKYQTYGFLLSSACAEVIADVFLCPFEAVKVRMQTCDRGAFTTNFFKGFNQIKSQEGWNGLYKGLKPLWMR
jgi:solute carrier family 25 phosphate transporter 3